MPAPTISPVVRAILSEDMALSADEVIQKARARGLRAPDKSIREAVYTIRSELRKARRSTAKPVPAAARETKPEVVVEGVAVPVTVSVPSSAPDLATMLANVALVNTAVGVSGGIEQARKVAEAVRACGTVDAFLQHLDVVAQVRGTSA